MTRWRLGAAALALLWLLGLAVASLPARLAARFIDAEQFALSGMQGSLWQGSAARAVLRTAVGPLHLGALRWRIHPWSLLSLSPRVTIDSRWGGQRIQVSRLWRRGQRWELRDLDAMLDAQLLSQFVPTELRGRISIQLDTLTATADALLAAQGRVVWQDAAWQTSNSSIPLGSYVAVIGSEEERGIVARIDTLSGSLRAQGELRVEARSYAVEARIEAPSGMDAQLARALSLIAAPTENGYLLRLNGDIAKAP